MTATLPPAEENEKKGELGQKIDANPAGFQSGEPVRQISPANLVTTGLDVVFTHLSYEVPIKKKEPLKILSDLSGNFGGGRLTALMGPSGSGKTTLMDIIAARKSGAGKISGEMLYGGQALPASSVKNVVGYVEQFDTLIGEFTVEQMLMYTAELKMPAATPYAEKQQRVNDIIENLRLSNCRKTKIGNVLKRGISGGQAKRVNIALALLTRPLVLCMDEPTSGLDSSMANSVCMLLQMLAKGGCTVLTTVHSPTSFAFSLFDDLFMLQSGGRTIYRGQASGAKSYFESQGFKMPADLSLPVPDWLVDITTPSTEDFMKGEDVVGSVDSLVTGGQKETDFAALWEQSDASKAVTKADEAKEHKGSTEKHASAIQNAQGPGQLRALKTLLKYRMRTHYKDGEFLGPRIGDKVFMGVLAMSLYWGIGSENDVKSVQSTASCLYFFTALCGYGAAAFVPSLTLERALFYRERADGCYAAWTYYVSKFIEEAVLCSVTSIIFCLITFFSLDLQGSFFVYTFAYFLTAMIGIVLAYAVAAVAPTMEAANALLPTYVTVCMYFGGLFILFDKIPTGWKWFSYTSFLRYSWGVLMLNQFDGEANGEALLFADDSGKLMNILEFYGMSDDDGIMNSSGACLAILGGLIFLFGFLGAVSLTLISHVKR
jgi:ABC-type multidrug transport system ATPase subunit